MDYTYFIPGLLTGKLQPRHSSAISKTIKDLLAQRRIPLHVTNIWNALYYRWNFEGGCHTLLRAYPETPFLEKTSWAQASWTKAR